MPWCTVHNNPYCASYRFNIREGKKTVTMVPEFQFITDSFRNILYVKKFHLESMPKVENDVRKKEKNKWISVFPLPHSITLALLVVCLSVLLCDYNILLMFHLITKPYFSYEIKIDAYFFCATDYQISRQMKYQVKFIMSHRM